MTSLSIMAIIDELSVAVYDNGIDSEEVSGLCQYIKNDADISAEEYAELNTEQKNLLTTACQYTGPV